MKKEKELEHLKRNTKSNKKKRKKRKRISFSTILLIIAAIVFVFSLFMLVDSLAPYFLGGQEYDEVRKLVIQQEKIENEEGEEEEKFIVDFDVLKGQNEDTIAWIRMDEPSVISYPVVKSRDNNEYLTKTFTANDNKLGTIFMDMNCASDFSDRNTIIYGHNMKVGGEMFSQLNSYKDADFCRENPNFYIYTPDNKVRTYQVFAAGIIKDTAKNYTLSFGSDEEFLNYLDVCKASSNYAVNVELNKDSKVVTLSTCTNVNEDERFVVQGVLLKEEVNE